MKIPLTLLRVQATSSRVGKEGWAGKERKDAICNFLKMKIPLTLHHIPLLSSFHQVTFSEEGKLGCAGNERKDADFSCNFLKLKIPLTGFVYRYIVEFLLKMKIPLTRRMRWKVSGWMRWEGKKGCWLQLPETEDSINPSSCTAIVEFFLIAKKESVIPQIHTSREWLWTFTNQRDSHRSFLTVFILPLTSCLACLLTLRHAVDYSLCCYYYYYIRVSQSFALALHNSAPQVLSPLLSDICSNEHIKQV